MHPRYEVLGDVKPRDLEESITRTMKTKRYIKKRSIEVYKFQQY